MKTHVMFKELDGLMPCHRLTHPKLCIILKMRLAIKFHKIWDTNYAATLRCLLLKMIFHGTMEKNPAATANHRPCRLFTPVGVTCSQSKPSLHPIYLHWFHNIKASLNVGWKFQHNFDHFESAAQAKFEEYGAIVTVCLQYYGYANQSRSRESYCCHGIRRLARGGTHPCAYKIHSLYLTAFR